MATLLTIAACSGMSRPGDPVLPIESALEVDGGTRRLFHALALAPETADLGHDGFVIGIEKAPRRVIGDAAGSGYERRFRRDRAVEQHLDDPNGMVVTHILAYEPGEAPEAIYNIYRSCPDTTGTMCPSSTWYEAGWAAMETSLVVALGERLRLRGSSGQPFTHLVIASTGWNNSQFDSLRVYRAVLDGLKRADPSGALRPIFVGVTWPSLWNTLGYASFRNKGHDADEVGHTYIAWLLHRLAPALKRDHDLKVVAIGHSFGARMVTRGLFSRPLVRDAAPTGEGVDLVVALQGAFNVARFLPRGNESPAYARDAAGPTPLVATWSRNDAYVLYADKIFSAEEKDYIGGSKGAGLVKQAGGDRFALLSASPEGAVPWPDKIRAGDVGYVDASAFIAGHSDICDANATWFLRSAFERYAWAGPHTGAGTPPRPAPPSAPTSCYGVPEKP